MPFYAIKRGYNTGIYDTWSECQAQIKNYKFPIFRKFLNIEDARDFMEEKPAEKNQRYQLWTDGSSDNSTYSSCAFIIVYDNQVIHQDCKILDKPYTNSHGEVEAIFWGLEYLSKNFTKEELINNIIVYSDSEFSIKTLNIWGEKRTEKEWDKKAYSLEFKEILILKKKFGISFEWVKAHVGNKYNEMVDRLAKLFKK
jgi:ribonuclease HI